MNTNKTSNFGKLVSSVRRLHEHLQHSAINAVNQTLTIRNWLIGYYIVEFEQNGEDRAKYGSSLLGRLSEKINIRGLTSPELSRCRQFYTIYPQTFETVSQKFKGYLSEEILGTLSQESNLHYPTKNSKATQNIITKLSYSHIVELIKIDESLKRTFYEVECIENEIKTL